MQFVTLVLILDWLKNKEKRKKNLERLLQYKYQGIEKVYIMYDGDESGKAAAKGLERNIKSTFDTTVIDLEDGMDPGKLTKEDVQKLRGILYD